MNTDEQLFQAYGFLASKEVLYEGIGNAGLVDRKSWPISVSSLMAHSLTEREAMHVVKQYIHLFGGDNTRVLLLVTPISPPSI